MYLMVGFIDLMSEDYTGMCQMVGFIDLMSEDYIVMYLMVGFELYIVIYLLLVCFVVFERLDKRYIGWGAFMVFNAIFNICSAMSWRSVFLVEEAGVP